MESLIGGGLITAISGIIIAVIRQGNSSISGRLDRIEDKLDGHIQWHLNDCPIFSRGGSCPSNNK